MTEPCVEGIIERESIAKAKERRQNAIRSELFRRKLVEHHDYRMFAPATAKKKIAEPVAAPKEPDICFSAEYKELWFAPLSEEPEPPMIDDVKRAVCSFYKITNLQLTSNRRHQSTTRPRQIAMYLARNLTGKSYPEIAKRLGRADHSTALNAIRRIEKLCHTDWMIAHDVAHLERGLVR